MSLVWKEAVPPVPWTHEDADWAVLRVPDDERGLSVKFYTNRTDARDTAERWVREGGGHVLVLRVKDLVRSHVDVLDVKTGRVR